MNIQNVMKPATISSLVWNDDLESQAGFKNIADCLSSVDFLNKVRVRLVPLATKSRVRTSYSTDGLVLPNVSNTSYGSYNFGFPFPCSEGSFITLSVDDSCSYHLRLFTRSGVSQSSGSVSSGHTVDLDVSGCLRFILTLGNSSSGFYYITDFGQEFILADSE